MERLTGLETEVGIIKGRDAIFLENITFNTETDLTLSGELNLENGEKEFEMHFKEVVFFSTVELDFDKRGQMESLALIEQSEKIKEFKQLDHSSKIDERHRHYYIRTYDTVFEIVSARFEFVLKT